ncbi:hypothetical protein B0A55_01380 [Friedmanniomyces simplex]|uniref:Cytochrome P450 52A13 n=1 Tax=Friedmanniomyces simplex TaxID=329884 RepID=A0A4U0Y394_9PEZI|nr:hypothetical protein B0A55_01380 [Friedmanniomyces simplex]
MVALQVGVLVAAYIAYKVIRSFIETRRFKAFAEQHGCENPLDLSEPWHNSFGRIRRIMNLKKTGEDILDDIIAEDFRGAATIQRKGFEGSLITSTVEPANLQAFLATQFEDFETGRLRYLQLSPILGKSIFTSDGAFWAHSRALFRPQFSRDNINDLDATDKAAHALITAIGSGVAAGWTRDVDLSPMFFNFTLDTASDFLFGESAESQAAMMAAQKEGERSPGAIQSAGAQAGTQQFRHDFEIVGEQLISRIRLFSMYWLADSISFRRAVARVKRFTEHYVQAAVNTAQTGKVEGKKETLLARLAAETQDRSELRNQTLAILFAGRDTTASLLGWAFLRLALHPEVFEKLRSVILKDFASDEPITFAKLKDCRYLRHFLNEVLRLHPTVPINGRTAIKDTTLPVGGGPDQKSPIAIRKGQAIGFSVYIMHRRKDLWGEDALEFKPERWEERIPAWQFLPFLGGPRVCIGQTFALIEASYLIVRMLRRYDGMEPVDEAVMLRMRKGLGLTMWPRDGVNVRLHEASG